MLQHAPLGSVFQALADPTRRSIVERLATGALSVSDLAAPFAVSLSAIGQHVHVLETSGLVRTLKTGRVRSVELAPEGMASAEDWFASHRKQWEGRLDRLGTVLAEPDDDEGPSRSR